MPFSVYFMKTTMHALLAFSEADPKFAVCAADAVTAENRNHWKKQEWSIGEQIGWELWEHTSWHYFRQGPSLHLRSLHFAGAQLMTTADACMQDVQGSAMAASAAVDKVFFIEFLLCRYKWGATPPEGHQCRIEEPLEGDVNGRKQQLRQQPFETVRDLLPDQIMYTVTDEDLSARLQRSF